MYRWRYGSTLVATEFEKDLDYDRQSQAPQGAAESHMRGERQASRTIGMGVR